MNRSVVSKLDKFFGSYKRLNYKKGEILVRVDDDPLGIFYLKKGKVKQYAISKNGEEVILNIFQPPAFFPLSWALNDTPNEFYYEAMTDIDAWRAPKEEVLKFLKNDTEVMYDLLCRIYRGIDGIFMRMIYFMSGTAYNRLVAEIIIQAKRFGIKVNGAIEIIISEKELAAETGMTRETVSREIKILKDKGYVSFNKKKLTILNLQGLEKQLED